MALYTCPGCKSPISESQPLDHCLGCEAMNQRQTARSASFSEPSPSPSTVHCTIIAIILRRPSQQYGPGSTPPPPSSSLPAAADVDVTLIWADAESGSLVSREPSSAGEQSRAGSGAINIRRD